jgi:hypothetical protein
LTATPVRAVSADAWRSRRPVERRHSARPSGPTLARRLPAGVTASPVTMRPPLSTGSSRRPVTSRRRIQPPPWPPTAMVSFAAKATAVAAFPLPRSRRPIGSRPGSR